MSSYRKLPSPDCSFTCSDFTHLSSDSPVHILQGTIFIDPNLPSLSHHQRHEVYWQMAGMDMACIVMPTLVDSLLNQHNKTRSKLFAGSSSSWHAQIAVSYTYFFGAVSLHEKALLLTHSWVNLESKHHCFVLFFTPVCIYKKCQKRLWWLVVDFASSGPPQFHVWGAFF